MRAMIALLVVLVTVVGCSAVRGSDAGSKPSDVPGMTLRGDFTEDGPGTLLSASTLPAVDLRIRAVASMAARVTYRSTSGIGGGSTTVSGTVFVPRGQPPEGGWRVLAYGHPSTGVQSDCAPSLDSGLLGAATAIVGLVKAGYVVTVPDYQGLGADGSYHPYLDATTEGFNVIDAVRAARKLVAGTSPRWAAIGVSQGGQAVWAANELVRSYGQAGTLVGVGSLSPAADVEGLVTNAANGTLTEDQKPAYQWLLVALANEYPDLDLDDYRRGLVEDKWDVLSQCVGPEAAERAALIPEITADDLRPASPQAVETLRGHLRQMSLPRTRAVAPMLVTYGGADQLVDPEWTERAVRDGCALGDVIDVRFQPDKAHGDVDLGQAFAWINDRFTDTPAPDSCRSLLQPPVTEEQ